MHCLNLNMLHLCLKWGFMSCLPKRLDCKQFDSNIRASFNSLILFHSFLKVNFFLVHYYFLCFVPRPTSWNERKRHYASPSLTCNRFADLLWRPIDWMLRESSYLHLSFDLLRPFFVSQEPRHLQFIADFSDSDVYTVLSAKKLHGAPTDYGLCVKVPSLSTNVKTLQKEHKESIDSRHVELLFFPCNFFLQSTKCSSARDLKLLCADDEQTRTCWITAMRLLKVGLPITNSGWCLRGGMLSQC